MTASGSRYGTAPAFGRRQLPHVAQGLARLQGGFGRDEPALWSLLFALGCSLELRVHSKASSYGQVGDHLQGHVVGIDGDGVPVRSGYETMALSDVEADEQVAAGREHPSELGEDDRQVLWCGVWMVEYQARAPPTEASGSSKAVIDPTSKRR